MELQEFRGVLVAIAKAPYREAGIEREAGLGFRLRLFQFSKIRQRCSEEEMGKRVRPVVLDRAAKQCDRLLLGAKIHLRGAREVEPEPGETVARREAQGFVFMSSSFFGVTDEYLGEADESVSGGQVRIERQRSLEFGNALVRAPGLDSGCRP